MSKLPLFNPPRLLRNRHLQTLWTRIRARRNRLNYRQQTLLASDGEQLLLHWAANITAQTKTIVLLLHGLEGSAESDYIKGMVANLASPERVPVVFEFRGCGQAPNQTERSYHSGEISDLSCVLSFLQQHYPTAAIHAVGFSLGGNVLVRYLGTTGSKSLVERAAVISAPLELAACAKQLSHWSAYIYKRYLLNSLVNKTIAAYQHKSWQHFRPPHPNQVRRVRSFWHFDNLVTAPLHGFDGADHYYQQCSGKQYLKGIQRPTLILHAQDDPFMNNEVIPTAAELSNHVDYVLTRHGGHVGFIQGSLLKPEHWLEQVVPDWLAR
ncbi:hydrolase [Neiella marina]|uniref:Hydrolase n=1 Tax=Neiella holothuriorum TaxID=2870530 RepID=A0ABS7EJ96_9GAMM|nr:hydrolase [Neiella holothuriorum]MBW8192360.1 hydrolase [Neiella holothuriorum]